MIKQIYVPNDIPAGSATVQAINVARGDRVYRNDVLLQLSVNGTKIPVVASDHGWVNYVFVKVGQESTAGQLLVLMNVVDVNEYRPDEQEVNQRVELGEHGRRGFERELQRKHVDSDFAAALFEAPEQKQGVGYGASVREHPLLRNMKEGVPAKMRGNASQNETAIDRIIEEAGADPELRKQLSQELQQELNIQPTHSQAPTLKV